MCAPSSPRSRRPRGGKRLFTPSHRGGSGPPLVLIHGFTDTWRTWELTLPVLDRHHDVLAVTLPGHAGGPAIEGPANGSVLADGVERAMDDAGLGTAHIAGNSLGGMIALQLGVRGRARTITALAPAGGWPKGDPAREEVLTLQRELLASTRAEAPHAKAILATTQGRRRATELLTVNFEHIPVELIEHIWLGVAGCRDGERLIAHALHSEASLDAGKIECPVRIVWGTADRLLPWPSAATRFRNEWLPHAEYIELDGVGHAPQLDVPIETAALILDLTSARRAPRAASP